MAQKALLDIQELHLSLQGETILQGLNLRINEGEVHAIMGPNGSGKSTLSYALIGREGYNIEKGKITYKGEDITALSADERARRGLFLALQYPIEIAGVASMLFLREAYNAHRHALGLGDVDMLEFTKRVRLQAESLGISTEMLKRAVNVGFSGGEKKRFEILQMAVLQPQMAVLDETDSGLDIDALKVVAKAVNGMRNEQRSFLMITHYQRLLDYIIPDYVHIMAEGRIVKSGNKDLARFLDQHGYGEFGKSESATMAASHSDWGGRADV